jgi:hypothetical protein
MTASPALVSLVQTDTALAKDPLTLWLRDHPEQIPLVLPVIVRSTGEFLRLMKQYPGARRELYFLARQVGMHKMGHYDGRA